MHRYRCYNAAMQTTAPIVDVATGAAVKTMLQIATPSTRQCQLIAWGYRLAAAPSTAESYVELIQTDVAATVTAHVAAGVQPLDPNAPASLMSLGTTATGYSASVEGTSTAVRTFDAVTIPITTSTADGRLSYAYQWMPDERPIVAVSKFLRVRVDMGSSVNMLTWVVWDE
jgi:hypothetical protein